MSSPKCKVVSIIPDDIYKKFKNQEILLKSVPDLKEYRTVFCEYTKNDVVSLERYYDALIEDYQHKESYHYDELEEAAREYIESMTFEQFKKALYGRPNDKLADLKKPITLDYSRYYHDEKQHLRTYEVLTVWDVWHLLLDGVYTYEYEPVKPSVYIYDKDIRNNVIEERTYKNTETKNIDHFLIWEEEC